MLLPPISSRHHLTSMGLVYQLTIYYMDETHDTIDVGPDATLRDVLLVLRRQVG